MAQRINQQYPTSLKEVLGIEYLKGMTRKKSHDVASR